MNTIPLITAFVSDPMFRSQITSVAAHLSYRIEWFDHTSERANAHRPEPPGERLVGYTGKLFEQVVAQQPALLLFDLGHELIPWPHWIAALKSSPATRRIPIIAFGPHEDTERLQTAVNAGANLVLPHPHFFNDIATLLPQHARIPNYDALAETCQQPLPLLVIQGLELFNRREYYQCHDALEAAWREDETAGRDLYRGILQVGIAYYQIQRGNYRGALKMLLRVRQWLDPLPAWCRGIHVAKLRQEATAVQEALTTLGADHITAFNQQLFQPIEYQA